MVKIDELYELYIQGCSYNDIINKNNLNITTNALKKRIKRYAKNNKKTYPRVNVGATRKAPTFHFNGKLDRESWDAYKNELLQRREIRIAFISDTHHPKRDWRAFDVQMQILKEFQPDVIPAFNDALDFATISRYPKSPDDVVKAEISKALESYKKELIMIQEIVPNVRFFSLIGNHDYRLNDHISNNMEVRPYKDMIENDFIRQFTDLGVYWLGWRNASEAFGNYVILLHGKYTSMHTAYDTYRKYSNKFNASVAGHTHRSDVYYNTSLTGNGIRVSTSAVAGCNTDLSPDYGKTDDPFNHQLGFALITIRTDLNEVYIENIVIHPETYTTIWGGRFYQAKE